ncbi:hypothetical protein H072_6901 [Dactylellina haptotyla CBS 200.50]|uniref:SCP domain-containing protein n=1 Tax=Dactylellina haptotyla (strain CBS 200.50) TaxID=1284197 RepID=S8ADZ5_DACHA|nr:hypothetical protein H072_6901 [Dactylellina haptotyla CBS 200.50]
MKGVNSLVVVVSLLSSCVTRGLGASVPLGRPDSVFLGPPVEHVDGQPHWLDEDLMTGPDFNSSDPTSTLIPRGPDKILNARASGPTSYTSREGKFSRDMLKITNDLRAIHGAPKVKWNKVLATYASRAGRKCQFKHSGGPYGENLAGGGPMNNPVWYQWYLYTEVQNYNYNNPGFSSATGHFTQLVWKGTTEMGCAWIAGCSNLSYMVWCEFSPPGNVSPSNNYVANVARPKRGIPKAPPTYDSWYH